MKSKTRPGEPFERAVADDAKKGARSPAEVDLTEASRQYTATIVDIFRFMEGPTASGAVLMPEVTISNAAKWDPLKIHFSWHLPDGESSPQMFDAIHNFMAEMSKFAPYGVICDTSTDNEGCLTIPRPELADEMLLRIVSRKDTKIYDPELTLSSRPGTFTPPLGIAAPENERVDITDAKLAERRHKLTEAARAGARMEREREFSMLEAMPAMSYMDTSLALAYAQQSESLRNPSGGGMLPIHLGRLRNLVAMARHENLPSPLLVLQ